MRQGCVAEMYTHRLIGVDMMHTDLLLHINTYQRIEISYKALDNQADNECPLASY